MFAIVDIESSGGNFQKDRIIEIAIIIHDGKKVVDQFATLINPLTPITPFVITLTGITDKMVESAPTFEQVSAKILEITKDMVFVAHNAKFDYGFLKSEFKRINLSFNRKQICTVNLSKKMLPHHKSYSLGNLCNDLGIEIKNRHRALGDTMATVLLLEHLISKDKDQLIKRIVSDEILLAYLPENLSKSIVDGLPEELGVFYFHDKEGAVNFIGRGKNIKEQIINLFENKQNKVEIRELKSEIFDITYELTGSELISSFIELSEIWKLNPKYNKYQGLAKYKYGIFKEELEGKSKLLVKALNEIEKPLIRFVSKKRAEKGIENLVEKFSVFANISMESEIIINKIVKHFEYPKANFFMIEEGRSGNERSAIMIEDGIYVGYGYFYPDLIGNDIQELKNCIKKDQETQEIKRLINSYYNKKKKNVETLVY
ncbi:MAG: hypothetical protein IPJ22_13650 [Bacteroidetes bacterium]|nr:hypothetical protein [Bacteroidota bacterium]